MTMAPGQDEPCKNDRRTTVRKEGRGTRFTGTEPVFGAFTHTSNIVTHLRLTHYGNIHTQMSDLGAAITAMAREYRFHGDAVRAYQDMVRVRSSFDGRVQQWRNEEFVRLQNKKNLNGNQLRELEKELNRVYLDIARGESALNRLQNDLDLISRVGDDCPLIQPQLSSTADAHETVDYVAPVLSKKEKPTRVRELLESMTQVDGFRLAFEDCEFEDDFDDTIREHCFNDSEHLALVIHWSNRNPVTRDRGNIYFRLYLVPKNVDSLIELETIIEQCVFEIGYNKGKLLLEFERLTIAQETTLVEPKLKTYLYDVAATGFEHRDLIVKRPFEFFVADVCPEVLFENGCQISFQLNLN
ncbi:MAG: hypothetical protein VX438_18535 [Planctomycetota bacterium]|nr:hypothetical protein [Planctomycetota bacterium]